MRNLLLILCLSSLIFSRGWSQEKQNDATTPLHLLKPSYDIPYQIPTKESISKKLDIIFDYLNKTTPSQLIDSKSNEIVKNVKKIKSGKSYKFAEADFRLTSYEWGVTYSSMLNAGDVLSTKSYINYTQERLNMLAEFYPAFKNFEGGNPLISVISPHALDDAGAICAAMIKTYKLNQNKKLLPLINNFIDYISNKQYRLNDGTLARNRPLKNAVWLDDLYMSIPALAQMGSLSGESKYFDDAVKQIENFSSRMFVEEKGLFMHGYIEEMDYHPKFYWGRANGWAILAMTELLDVLPETHHGYEMVENLLKKHIQGLIQYQSKFGLWHQLLDKNDSYLETSATAIYTYCIARAINKGRIDSRAYGPVVTLAWNALNTKINENGQINDICVGTGMGFDPAYYYYRPVNVYAAHGYGPMILAGSEMIKLIEKFHPAINDSAIQFYNEKITSEGPIFKIQ